MAEPLPRVTVVVPTHRRSASLATALEKLAAQTFPRDRFDVVVVGDGTPEERRVIDEARTQPNMPALQFLTPVQDPLQGASASLKRNVGAAASSGDILAFTDDDCLPHADWIASAVPHFADARVGGVQGRTVPVAQDPPTIHYRQTLHLGKPGGYASCNMFYRRRAFDEVKGFDPALPFYKEDSDLGFSVLDRGWTIPYEAKALVEHPVRAEAPWNVFAMALKTVYDPLLHKKHPRLYRKYIGSPLTFSDRAYMGSAAMIIAGLFLNPVLIWLGAALFAAVLGRHWVVNFSGARFTIRELIGTTLGLVLSPYVKLVQLARGNLRYRTFLWI